MTYMDTSKTGTLSTLLKYASSGKIRVTQTARSSWSGESTA